MHNSETYNRLMKAIIAEGLHTEMGLRYLFDLSTRLQLWNEDYKVFLGRFGCDYASACAGIGMGKEPEIARFQREFKNNFPKEYQDEMLPSDHRLIAGWCLYLINPDNKAWIDLDGLVKLIDHWLKHLQRKNISVSKIVESLFTLNISKSMTEETYIARVVLPFINGVDSAMPPVQLELITLLRNCKKEIAANRVIEYVHYVVKHNILTPEEALQFLTKAPALMPDYGSIALAIAKYQDQQTNQQLQILLKSLVSDKLPMKQMVRHVLHYAYGDENSYATQLAENHYIAECTEVLAWMQEIIKERANDCLSQLLPTAFLKNIIRFKDSVIYKHLLILFTELLTNPYIVNDEFLRLQMSFLQLKKVVEGDSTIDKFLREDLETKKLHLQRYMVLHNLEHRRVRFDGAFATDLRTVCMDLLQQPLVDIKQFEGYLLERLKSGNLDAAGKTICFIYLQCIYDAAHKASSKELKKLSQFLTAKKNVEKESASLPPLFLTLTEANQAVVQNQLWSDVENLKEFARILHGKPIEQVSRDVRNIHSILFVALGNQLDDPVFLKELNQLLENRINYFNQKEIALKPPEKSDDPQQLRRLKEETKKFDDACVEGQEQLTQLFIKIQNNYSTYSSFILALLNLDGSHRIWYPAILALATVNKKLFQELFDRAMNDCNRSPIAAKSMLISAMLLFKKKKFDSDEMNNHKYFKQLFIDELGVPRRFTFKIVSESDSQVNQQWLESLELLKLDFDPVAYFSRKENFYKNLILEFLVHCDQARCLELLKLIEKFLLSSKLDSSKAEQLYGLLEQCELDIEAMQIPKLRKIQMALSTFLRQNMLIRVHYYIENRSAKRLDSDFESRFQEFLKFLKTGKVGDLSPFQKWGHTQRFSTYIQAITHYRDKTIIQAKHNYRQFLYARVVNEKERFADLNIRVQIINRRLLLSLLPNDVSMKEKIEKIETEMEQYCKQYADDLRDTLPKQYNEALLGILWLTGFSKHARQMVTTHIGSKQPYKVSMMAHYLFGLPDEMSQLKMVTSWLWEDYVNARHAKLNELDKLENLCEWINRSCIGIRQQLRLEECDEVIPCLKAIIIADFEQQNYEAPEILVTHPELTRELILVILQLRPQMQSTCYYLSKQVSEKVEEIRAAIALV